MNLAGRIFSALCLLALWLSGVSFAVYVLYRLVRG